MNIRELQLFRHLSESLHFGRTSKACNITPSGLTRTIQRLEDEIGQELFLRDKRSVTLTFAGESFRKYSDDVLLRWEQFQSSLSKDSVLRGELSLYCSLTAILTILPDILSLFRKTYPDVQINLKTGDAAMALSKLENDEADITIAALPDSQQKGIDFIKTIETPLIFISSARFPETIIHKEGNARKVDWQQTPIIMPERGLSRQRTEAWFTQKNIQPNIYSHVAGNEAIIAMVGMGCGIGVIPQLVLEKSHLKEEITVLEVSPKLKPFSVGVCTATKNKLKPVVQAFWSIVEKQAS